MYRGYLLTIVALFTLMLGIASPMVTHAATGASNGAANGFTISPVLTEITVDKGGSQTVPITLSNPTSVSLVAEPIINDFVASSDESGTPNLILKNNAPLPALSFAALVSPIQPVTLGPNQTVTVNVVISVPKDALSGGYYGAVRFQPATSGAQQNVGLTASVGSLFLVTVPGNLTEKLTVTQFSAADTKGNPSTLFTNGQISALLRIENSGNIYSQPFGTIELKNMWGHIVSVTQFNSGSPKSSILEQSTRKFIVALPHYSYLGHYTLIASIGYGNGGGNLIVTQTSFWYIPIWLQIVILAVIVGLVVLIYWAFHKLKSRRL